MGAEDGDELGDLDADSNLESVGSGSGLLDLSLQADDTSLGAVLDDILPAAIAGEPEGLDLEDNMAEEADKIFEASQTASGIPPAPEPEPLPRAPAAAPGAYAASVAETSSSAFSFAVGGSVLRPSPSSSTRRSFPRLDLATPRGVHSILFPLIITSHEVETATDVAICLEAPIVLPLIISLCRNLSGLGGRPRRLRPTSIRTC